MNAVQKYVVSTTLADASAWRNSTLIKDDVVEQVRAMKAQPGKNILMDGSSVLIHTLAQNDLIDEYSLLVYPARPRRWQEDVPRRVADEPAPAGGKSFPTGVALMRYAVERPTSGE